MLPLSQKFLAGAGFDYDAIEPTWVVPVRRLSETTNVTCGLSATFYISVSGRRDKRTPRGTASEFQSVQNEDDVMSKATATCRRQS